MKLSQHSSLPHRFSSLFILAFSLLMSLTGCGDDDPSYHSSQAGTAPTSPGGFIASDFQVTPVPPEIRDRYKIDTTYYTKYTSVWGIPITAGPEVADIKLKNAAEMIGLMLSDDSLSDGNGKTTRDALFQNMFRAAIYPTKEGIRTQQLPEFRGFSDAGGYGATTNIPVMGFGELDVSECSITMGPDYGRNKHGNSLVHELMHSIHHFASERIRPGFNSSLNQAYRHAFDHVLWDRDWYILENELEYLAEGAEVWFNWYPYGLETGDDILYISQDNLSTMDPYLFDLLSVFFRPSQDILNNVSFCSPRILLTVYNQPFDSDMKPYTSHVSVYGDDELLSSATMPPDTWVTSIAIPDPRISPVSHDNYTITLTVDFEPEAYANRIFRKEYTVGEILSAPRYPLINVHFD